MGPVRIVVSPDFHGYLPPDVAPCDLLLLGADCLDGDLDRLAAWLARQPARAIVGIAGNHDFIAAADQERVRRLPWRYLRDEAAEIEGMCVFGSPLALPFGEWAFMAPEAELEAVWARIPAEVEIVLVHGPALGVLDRTRDGRHAGSASLRARLDELPRLRLVASGHIHEAYGQTAIPRLAPGAERGSIACVNASFVDAAYRPGNPPLELEL
jgi:Icc-related predicted phosphoesterase